MRTITRLLLIALFFLCTGCEESTPYYGHYSIGRDQTWFPLDFGVQTPQINAFVNSLVLEMGKAEKVRYRIVDTDWLILMEGLEQDLYAGIFSSLSPTPENQNILTFSEPFLKIGPVLIVRKEAEESSLKQMPGKIIGMSQFDESMLIAQQYPVIIKLYQEMPLALEDLVQGSIDAVLMPALDAAPLISKIYYKSLKITSPPLNDKGLRLISIKGKHERLQERFKTGLENLNKSGKYEEILKQFSLSASAESSLTPQR